jgi:hypothetical protein
MLKGLSGATRVRCHCGRQLTAAFKGLNLLKELTDGLAGEAMAEVAHPKG